MEKKSVKEFSDSVESELSDNIVPFWLMHTRDCRNGGFYGRISNDLVIKKKAHKSLILTARILWTFAALHHFSPWDEYLRMAEHAYASLLKHFFDEEYGGAFWLVDYKGKVINEKKKIYGQAFTIYALSEFYGTTGRVEILDKALEIYRLIEKHNYDRQYKGYFETSNRDWTIAEEMRLSEVDMNEMKSMNTHLHLLEAYTNLYRYWPDPELKKRLKELIDVFISFIIDPQTDHFKLFFDERWNRKSDSISFGHDIEGSWLLCEAAAIVDDEALKEQIKKIAIDMVNATMKEGFSERFGIFAEMNGDGTVFREVHWWQQAEAVVGFINAYQITSDSLFLDWAVKAWKYITDTLVDRTHGEWFYEISEDGKPDNQRYKVSEWKGPYHNGRACLEILKRLSF
jgi:mannobiose 2-epimerase